MTTSSRQRIELLQLRSVEVPPSPILHLQGPLVQKGSGKGRKRGSEIAQQIDRELDSFHWKAPPRAKIAMEFHFFSDQNEAPALHNLVKYYMDLLKGRAFSDDRQVHYLEASRVVRSGFAAESYAVVERLSRRMKRIALYDRYKDDFGDWLNGWNDVPDSILPSKDIPTPIIQHSILSHSQLRDWQRPGNAGLYQDYFRELQAADPFTISIGDLPAQGGTEEYRCRIRKAFQDFSRKHPNLCKIDLPVELDIQVTPAGLHLGKDLDNIAIDVCPNLIDELLGREGLLRAYRAYVVDRLPQDVAGGIWIKLLPMGSILEQGHRVRTVIERATEELSS